MGVWKRKEGKWFYRFDFKGKQYWKGGFESKRQAQEAELVMRNRLETQKSLVTFEQAVEMRIAEVRTYSTEAHARRVATCLHRFVELWGEHFLGEITTLMIKNWIRNHAKKQGNAWVNKHLVFLKSLLIQMVNEGMLANNPAVGILKLSADVERKHIHPVENIEAIIALAAPADAAYLTTVWLTAARVREINHLRWEDVDLEHNTLTLYTRKKKGGARKPRVIPMVKRVQESVKNMNGIYSQSPWVFTNPDMIKRYPSDPERWFYDYRDKFHKRLARDAGVPPINYHELRHHCASYLASQGVELTVIQQILGHERATTTDIYLQQLPGSLKNGMAALENL